MYDIQKSDNKNEDRKKLYLFNWNDITGNDNKKLIGFLKEKYDIMWVDNAKIEKIDDGKTISISYKDNSLSLKLNNDETKANLKIDDVTTDEFIVEKEKGKLNIYDFDQEKKQQAHVLLKVKPEYTEKFFVAMTIFKSFYDGKKGAKIEEVCSIFEKFDFSLNISGEEKEINRTIFEIRDMFGEMIYETSTIKKFKIPITKEEMENILDKILGKKSLAKLPGRDGEKVPSKDDVDLKEMADVETTALENLIKKANIFCNYSALQIMATDTEMIFGSFM